MSEQTIDRRIPICFDVLGTCFSFDKAVKALLTVFPDLDEKRASSIIDDWFHAAQRDFTYLSMNGEYKPIAQVLKLTLPRIYLMHKLIPSTSASSIESNLLEPVTISVADMSPRPGLVECSRLLLESDPVRFRLLAVTNGALETTRNLFRKNLTNDSSQWEYISCDEIKIAKPDRKVYDNVWKRLGAESGDSGDKYGWFVASHTWDLHAAKKAGFKTAYVTHEEYLTLPELFGQPDIVAHDLEDIARQIIGHESSKAK
ncbi:uncharacterized protein JCM15063_002071 [Sporobolomyces koalae]|uniref:uncharacterized protein n=1 Tax=Sporobolomyces koalae TaxID=500713 RepID=UPI00316FFF13